jgi:site-specific recombinase XerD
VVTEIVRHVPEPSTAVRPAGHTGLDSAVSDGTRDRLLRAKASATTRAYTRHRQQFVEWCDGAGRVPLPCTPQTLVEYASHLMDCAVSPTSISQAMAAIRTGHAEAGYPTPTSTPVVEAMRTYRRDRAAAGSHERPAEALRIDPLRAMVQACPDSLAGARDRAILLLGWAMMGRRSELVNLDIADVPETDRGLLVRIGRSKTDRDALGVEVAVPYGSHGDTCPVRQVGAWVRALAERDVADGPLFRRVDRHGRLAGDPRACGRAGLSPRLDPSSIWHIVRRAAVRAGVPTRDLSPHSLRSGGATGAREGGADMLEISRHGRWKDGSPTVYRYVRAADRWTHNPMAGSGL